jgi:hypothetical protein
MCEKYKPGIDANTRVNVETKELEYKCADGYFIDECDVCQHCLEEVTTLGKPYRMAERRNSFGYYAGRYCDSCWASSGYRDATDPDAEFDETYAGESLHGEPDDQDHLDSIIGF